MKSTFLVLLVSCWASHFTVFSQTTVKELTFKGITFRQTTFQRNIRDKETLEIAYIVNCIKASKSADSLTVWKSSGAYEKGEHEYNVPFKYRSRLAFFKIYRSPEGAFLKSIVYDRSSAHKVIFSDDATVSDHAPADYAVNAQTRFAVWMSRDRLSIYFGMIHPDKVVIWVFTSDLSVYMVQHKLSP